MAVPTPRVYGTGLARTRDVPILLCGHHKVGTNLLLKVVKSLAAEFDWSFRVVAGRVETPPTDADVVVLLHSLVNLDSITMPYTGAHFIRDPRDVIVSGYLYHRRCTEPWCTNELVYPSRPIRFPKVPFLLEHRPEAWKEQYLNSLGGKSYQENLRGLNQRDGLLFEMHNYGRWTIEGMLDWDYSRPGIVEVRFETLMSEFDATFKSLFEHFGLSGEEISKALEIAAKEDLSRMTEEEIQEIEHVSSSQTTRWREFFEDVHKETFKQLFGDALVRLGYEDSNDW